MMWVAVVYAGDRLLADLQDRPPAGAGELRPPALQRRFPLPHGPGARERREHRTLPRRARRGAAARGRVRPDLRRLVGLHALQQASDLAHRLLWPGGRRLSAGRRFAALLHGSDPARRADPDSGRVRPGPGLAVLVRRRLADARRLESHRRPADHLRREHGGGPPGHEDRLRRSRSSASRSRCCGSGASRSRCPTAASCSIMSTSRSARATGW